MNRPDQTNVYQKSIYFFDCHKDAISNQAVRLIQALTALTGGVSTQGAQTAAVLLSGTLGNLITVIKIPFKTKIMNSQ
jgi:hypothetical protein